MRAVWAIAAGLLLGGGTAWWLARESPDQQAAKSARAAEAARRQADDARPALYRWRDAQGTLHVGDKPPRGVAYERIDRDTAPGISIRGDGDADADSDAAPR